MKKTILSLYFLVSFTSQAWASTQCFIAREGRKVIHQEGDCKERYAPCSTFKIALSLIGYDS
ncbi:MAG: class D beta-lactamase, partial [Janthinobacterium lividum]